MPSKGEAIGGGDLRSGLVVEAAAHLGAVAYLDPYGVHLGVDELVDRMTQSNPPLPASTAFALHPRGNARLATEAVHLLAIERRTLRDSRM